MNRTCDGTDPNLTREIPLADYDPQQHRLSPWTDIFRHPPDTVVICCDCGLTFNDAAQRVLHPHDPVGPGPVIYTPITCNRNGKPATTRDLNVITAWAEALRTLGGEHA